MCGVYVMKVNVTDIERGKTIDIKDILLTENSILAIDASTTCSGLCFIGIESGKPGYSLSLTRDKKQDAIEYKVEFKGIIKELLLGNRSIYKNVGIVVQEEPFISAMKTSSAVLMSLRTSIPELKVENKEYLENLEYHEINNKTWKKFVFKPDKCPSNTELEKSMARRKISTLYPIYKNLTQDEVDACGIAITSVDMLKKQGRIKDKQRTSKFKYSIKFIQAQSLQEAIDDILEISDIPKTVIDNGISVVDLPSNGNLDKKIYEEMGEDDRLLVFEFTRKTAGNLILKYKLSYMSDDDGKIYALVWRENRKK